MEHRTATEAVHAGRDDFRDLGVHAPPLDLSSTYPLASLDEGRADLDAYAAGAAEGHSPLYARLHNPTVRRWERALATLEHAEDAVAFSSGMAALTAVLLACRVRDAEDDVHRDRIVAVRPLYGGTDHLLASGLLGFRTRWTAAADLAQAVDDRTALVLLETPANPTLALVDIAAAARAVGPVPVLVDNTFATPVLQNPLRHGAAFAMHSATKALGGHGDVLAGAVACDATWAARLRQVRILTGAVMHPLAGWLLHRSLPTLPLRVERAQATAAVLAERLAGHPAVKRVLYPGLADPLGLLGRQMRGPGAVLAIDLAGGHDAAAATMGAVRLFTPAVSLGAADSLIQHPADLTHRIVAAEARDAGGVGPGLLRLSIGLEDAEDLWQDLARALAAG